MLGALGLRRPWPLPPAPQKPLLLFALALAVRVRAGGLGASAALAVATSPLKSRSCSSLLPLRCASVLGALGLRRPWPLPPAPSKAALALRSCPCGARPCWGPWGFGGLGRCHQPPQKPLLLFALALAVRVRAGGLGASAGLAVATSPLNKLLLLFALALAVRVRAGGLGASAALAVATSPLNKLLLLFALALAVRVRAGGLGASAALAVATSPLTSCSCLGSCPCGARPCRGPGASAGLPAAIPWPGLLLFWHAGPGVQAPGGGLGAKPPIQSSWL